MNTFNSECANKFEFLEDFRPYKPTTWFEMADVDGPGNNAESYDWRLYPYDASNHTIKLMVGSEMHEFVLI